jgi:hypothetical protein
MAGPRGNDTFMPFPYYERLSARNQAIYRRSDAVAEIALPHPELLQPLVGGLQQALALEKRKPIELAATHICRGITEMLEVPAARIQVLAVRPSRNWGELHGLYTLAGDEPAKIQVWMRTARHRRIVAFRTFLRTLLHELGHHLDYTHLRLPDSFHTEGFFKRESSLFRQLVPPPA